MSSLPRMPVVLGARVAFTTALAMTLLATLGSPGDAIPLNDKLAHAAAFALLAALARFAVPARSWWIVAAALAALGAVIELAQGTSVIARDADILDWLADLAGIALGLAFALALPRATARRRSRR